MTECHALSLKWDASRTHSTEFSATDLDAFNAGQKGIPVLLVIKLKLHFWKNCLKWILYLYHASSEWKRYVSLSISSCKAIQNECIQQCRD